MTITTHALSHMHTGTAFQMLRRQTMYWERNEEEPSRGRTEDGEPEKGPGYVSDRLNFECLESLLMENFLRCLGVMRLRCSGVCRQFCGRWRLDPATACAADSVVGCRIARQQQRLRILEGDFKAQHL
jgi:hypothetical protein